MGIARLTGRDLQNLQLRTLRLQVPPLGQRSSAALFENIAAVEMAFVVEVVVDRGMDSGKFLQSFYVPEFGHCPFPPSKG